MRQLSVSDINRHVSLTETRFYLGQANLVSDAWSRYQHPTVDQNMDISTH